MFHQKSKLSKAQKIREKWRNDPTFLPWLHKEYGSVLNADLVLKFDPIISSLGGRGTYEYGISYKGSRITMKLDELVWTLTNNKIRYPRHDIDHINDNHLDNRPENLQQITHEEHLKKAKTANRKPNRGGKLDNNFSVTARDGKFTLSRIIKRSINGQIKTGGHHVGRFNTREEAEEYYWNNIHPCWESNYDAMLGVVDEAQQTTKVRQAQGTNGVTATGVLDRSEQDTNVWLN